MLGEVELVVARFAGGGEVRALPVPLVGGEFRVALAGVAANAVIFVIGVETGEVTQLGRRAGGREHRPSQFGHIVGPEAKQRGPQFVEFGLFQRLEPADGVGVFDGLVLVPHRHARRGESLVGPDRVQQALRGRQLPRLQGRHALLGDLERLAADLFHRHEADVRLVARIDRLVQRRVFSSQGLNLNMITSMNPPLAAFCNCSAMEASWVEKPTNFTLPVFLIASTASFISLLLGQSVLARVQPVIKEQVDVIGAEMIKAEIDLLEHVFRLADSVLGCEEDILADLGLSGEPVVEDALGIPVPLGRVEIAHAFAVGVAKQRSSEAGWPTVPWSSIVTATPVLPSTRLGNTGLF